MTNSIKWARGVVCVLAILVLGQRVGCAQAQSLTLNRTKVYSPEDLSVIVASTTKRAVDRDVIGLLPTFSTTYTQGEIPIEVDTSGLTETKVTLTARLSVLAGGAYIGLRMPGDESFEALSEIYNAGTTMLDTANVTEASISSLTHHKTEVEQAWGSVGSTQSVVNYTKLQAVIRLMPHSVVRVYWVRVSQSTGIP